MPFTKGDPHINRKGRPKSFDKLRALAQAISHEVATGKATTDKDGNVIPGKPIEIDGHVATVAEMVLRQWATSKDPRLQIAFIEYAYGKVPVKQENYNVDLDNLTREELEKIANGEDPTRVLKRFTASSSG